MSSRTRRILQTALILMVALSIIAATGTVKVRRIKFGQDLDIASGRAGIRFSSSQYTGTVKLTRVGITNSLAEETPSFITKWIDLRLYKDNDDRVTHIVGAVYVYFTVRRAQARLFENGELTIYFYDTWKKEWTACSTFAVKDKNQTTRVACRMSTFGLYGLGYK